MGDISGESDDLRTLCARFLEWWDDEQKSKREAALSLSKLEEIASLLESRRRKESVENLQVVPSRPSIQKTLQSLTEAQKQDLAHKILSQHSSQIRKSRQPRPSSVQEIDMDMDIGY